MAEASQSLADKAREVLSGGDLSLKVTLADIAYNLPEGGGGGGGTDDQTATEVPFTPAGTLESVNVQAALAELDAIITAYKTAVGTVSWLGGFSVETALGTWTVDPPSRANGTRPWIFICFGSSSNPKDATNGVPTPENVNVSDIVIRPVAV